MPAVFDHKNFNPEVFQGYYDRIPNTKRNELIKGRAIRNRDDLAAALAEGTGGNFITTQLRGLIGGEPTNYDGSTDIDTESTVTFSHDRVVIGRAKSWTEKDFSYDITGGEDFMENIAAQIHDYWDDVDQNLLIAILKGVFAMTDAEGAKFVQAHTHDVTAVANSEGKMGMMDGTTLNSAMQKACGDNKGKFSLAIMHSMVATNLENLKLLTYAKFNDADGMQHDITLATLNGRLVMVDDSMPTEQADDGSTIYTTYAMGEGAIEFTNCGVKVPHEMDRNPAKNGGQDTLYSRQRKCWSPFGISFTKKHMVKPSPTNAELSNGENWMLVHSEDADDTQYIDHKAIPICQILSKG